MKYFCLFFLCFLLYIQNFKGQNVYGVTGLIKTPTAYTLEDGKAFVSLSLYDDYYKSFDKKRNLFWTQSINIGFLSRLELGIRLVNYPDIDGGGHDRNLSLKFTIIKERKYIPQFSVGFQDGIGTRRYNNTYFVVSKNIAFSQNLKISPSLGYGTKLTDKIYNEKAHDYRNQGFFASTEIKYGEVFSLLFEFHKEGKDAGIKITPLKWLHITSFVNTELYLGLIFGIYLKI